MMRFLRQNARLRTKTLVSCPPIVPKNFSHRLAMGSLNLIGLSALDQVQKDLSAKIGLGDFAAS